MCGITKDFNKICRLCLALISDDSDDDDDGILHGIFTERVVSDTDLPRNSSVWNNDQNKICNSCDKLDMRHLISLNKKRTSESNVPFRLTSTKIDLTNDYLPYSIFKMHRNNMNSLRQYDSCTQSDQQTDFANCSEGQAFSQYDDSPHIITQILHCLSLEVSKQKTIHTYTCIYLYA